MVRKRRIMTERKYECVVEFRKEGVPYGMSGEIMTLREWLLKTRKYKKYFEYMSDENILSYIAIYLGKYLEEV